MEENGKTPIMVLQELMMRKRTLPEYTLILSEARTHLTTFSYEVKCDNLKAFGTASTKKQAKQNAADAMLRLLQIELANATTSTPSPILKSQKTSDTSVLKPETPTKNRNPSVNTTHAFVNYVGELQTLCKLKWNSEPVYHEAVISGPQHCLQFTIKCCVSELEATGTAMTKKQAKHLAAQEVLQLLTQQIERENSSDLSEIQTLSSVLSKVHLCQTDESKAATTKAISQYKKLPVAVSVKDRDLLANSHMLLKNSYHTGINVNKLKDWKKMVGENCAITGIVKKIEDTFAINVEQIVLKSKVDTRKMFAFQMNFSIVITEIGTADTLKEAQVEGLCKFIDALMHLIK